LYEFFWNDYCDWYLEFSKPVLWDETASDERKRGTYVTLLSVLEAALRMLHPFMPFITEEIWQRTAPLLGEHQPSIMLASYPQITDFDAATPAVNESIECVQALIGATRTLRSDMNLSPGQSLPAVLFSTTTSAVRAVQANQSLLIKLAKLESLSWAATKSDIPASASLITGDIELCIPLAGLIDVDQEVARITKRIEQLTKEIARIDGKLGNPNFANKAPAPVVAKEKEKLDAYQNELGKMQEQLESVKALK
jgi:valyl-tRNA synthetase